MEIKHVEIFRSGKTSDGRLINTDFIKYIYKNTKILIDKHEFKIPIKLGHFDLDENAKGYITDIYLNKKETNTEISYSIYADFKNIPKKISEKITDGLLPGRSIEIASKYYTKEGHSLNNVITALALLGHTLPAIPWLKKTEQYIDNENENENFSSQKEYYQFYKINNEQLNHCHSKSKKEDIKFMNDYSKSEGYLKDNFSKDSLLNDNSIDKKIDELTKENLRLKDEITTLKLSERKSFFNKLVKEGRLFPSQQDFVLEHFNLVNDDDKVKKFYSSLPKANYPDLFNEVAVDDAFILTNSSTASGNDDNSKPINKEYLVKYQNIANLYKNAGFDEDEILECLSFYHNDAKNKEDNILQFKK